eukprot:TRINITY_DN24674_c0_g1_i1.p1 TRINITY_DN24674_c0_g1~~TRINITY_DN24674_c0_g1_i1.p1  ORF type:complete len:525 (+),score=97.89 TRINITY_DN24674_c0_g1_i1:35-1609(+)
MEPSHAAVDSDPSDLRTEKAEAAKPDASVSIETSASELSKPVNSEPATGTEDPLVSELFKGILFGEGVHLKTDSVKTAALVVETFRRFDLNGNGTIEFDEMTVFLQHLDPEKWTKERVARIFSAMDRDKNDAVDFTEFVAWSFSKVEDGDDFREACNLSILVPRATAAPSEGTRIETPVKSIPAPRVASGAIITSLAVANIGSRSLAAVGFESGQVCIIDLEQEKCLRTLHLDGSGSARGGKSVTSLHFSADRSMLACSADMLYIFSVAKGDCLARLSNDRKEHVKDCAWGPGDSKIVVAEGAASKIWELDLSDRGVVAGKISKVYRADKVTEVYGCCFADGAVVSVGRSDSVFIFNEPPDHESSGRGRRRSSRSPARGRSSSPAAVRPVILEKHYGHVTHCSTSACGKFILSLSTDKIPAVWDFLNAKLCTKLIGHSDHPTAGTFLEVDGSLLVITGSMDGTARIWTAQDGRCLVLVDVGTPVIGLAIEAVRSEHLKLVTSTREGLQTWQISTDFLQAEPVSR